MDEDFNTPEAYAVLFEMASEVNRTRSPALAAQLRALGKTLGLLQQNPRAYLQGGKAVDADAIAARIEARAAAKRARDFALADRIRRELADDGVILQDTPSGTTWVKA
jgi:cysteinyl-tRNA synthetase